MEKCIECNQRPREKRKNSKPRPKCQICRQNKKPHIKHRQSCCSLCGFIPIHYCQLDVDHIDQNHNNNEPSNLQTLCANCHRLKTFKERGGLIK